MAKEAAAKTNPKLVEQKPEPSIDELISRRAYELYEQRGCTHGSHVEDWLQAEAEVKAQLAAKGDTAPK